MIMKIMKLKIFKVILFSTVIMLLFNCTTLDKKEQTKKLTDEEIFERLSHYYNEYTIGDNVIMDYCSSRGFDEKIIFIGAKSCHFANKTKPIIDGLVKKYKLDKYYIKFDLDNKKDEDFLKKRKLNIYSTPVLIIDCFCISGSASEKEYQKLFEKFKNTIGKGSLWRNYLKVF